MSNAGRLLVFSILFLIFVFLLVAYWPGLHGPFFLDDLQTIGPTKMARFSLKTLLEISLQNDTGPLGRPLSVATFALNSYWFGDAPFSYKAVNLGLHVLIGLAVGCFIYLLIMLVPRSKKLAIGVAVLSAVLWLIHPLQVSTVLYPVQRMTQLCHLFILLGLNTYLIGRARLLTKKPHAISLMLLSFLFIPLSILSKETGILFVWYLFIIEYFILKFKTRDVYTQHLLRLSHYCLSLGLLFAGLCYYWLHLTKFLTIFAEKNLTLLDRLLTQTKVMILYLKLILFPQISQMSLYHDDFPISTTVDSNVAISCIILLYLGCLIFYCKKRAPIISFGLAWFFVSQTIESTALPLELVFEHRCYLASVGLLLIPSYYFVRYCQKASETAKVAFVTLLASLMTLLLFVTYSRSESWATPQNFLAEELYYHPQSARAHIEFANWYLMKNQYENAVSELNIAQDIQPYNAGIAVHKLLIFCRSKSAPPEMYEQALIKVKQGAITPYVILVLDQMVRNMFNQSCNAIDQHQIKKIIQQALNNPFIGYKPNYSAVLYHLEGGIALLDNDLEQSRYLLNKSYEIYPKRIDPLIEKAYLELQHGLLSQAQETIDKIRTKNPSSEKVAKLIKTMQVLNSNTNKKP